jgi:Flp pilus assembly protein TadD
MRANRQFLFATALAALLAGLALPAAAADRAAAPAAERIEPVFPVENGSLVFMEGEDAVSTNFAREPVLNYGCSGFRALQLNRSTGLEGVGTFYADYVFSVPSAGTWELWYGGTPPGPRDDLYPSYSSPFTVTVDGQRPLAVSRETMAVVENYTPSFYWNLVSSATLAQGRHRIRFEVTERRRIDGRFMFYLDCFFLVKKEGGKRILTPPLPPVFPKDPDSRAMNTPFASIDDMLIRVRDTPGATGPLVELSLVYTLLGDNLNALKYLNAAALVRARDPQITLLIAKNRIWKGDTAGGLRAYRELLDADPSHRELWLEAGKVAAWTGRSEESVRFFTDGLAAFPKDLDLLVNLGLAYLWSSRGQEAERVFREAQAVAGSDAARIKEMAGIYRVNGYPDRAVAAYNAAIQAAPRDLEARLLLVDALQAMGRTADADGELAKVADAYVPSPRLEQLVASFREKQGLKEQVLAEYRQRLAENPDNLVLRQTLAQAYFWNGQRSRAIQEYRHILDNHAYLAVREAEAKAAPVTGAADRQLLLAGFFGRVPFIAQQKRSALAAAATSYRQALSARDAAEKSLAAARAAQAKAGGEGDKALAAVQAEEDRLLSAEQALAAQAGPLAAAASDARAFTALVAELRALSAADRDAMAGLQEADAKAEEAFRGAAARGGWTFDRAGTLADLLRDAPENALARLVAAKIHMMDRQTESALALLAKAPAGQAPAPEAAWTMAQGMLWAGREKEAAAAFARLAADAGTAGLPPSFAGLAALQKTIESAGTAPAAAPAAAGQGAAEDPLAALEAATAELASAEKGAGAEREAAQRTTGLLQTLYRRAMVRGFYAWDATTAPIRNELGDYYLAQEPPGLADAIVQFRKVLAIDPGDLSASFRLGKVYQWKRDWKAALDQYARVYKADPSWENVAALYNQVAREHADSFLTQTSYEAEAERTRWHAEWAVTHLFNTTWGLSLQYQLDAMRIQRGDGSGATDHSSWQAHDVALGVPIEFVQANVRLVPWAGVTLTGNALYGKDAGPFTDGLAEATVDPVGRLDASAGVGDILFASAGLRWGRQVETLDPVRAARIYDASAEANLTTRFSFIDAWPFRDTTLRAYGRLDLLHTAGFAYENLLATVTGELTVHALKGGTPYSLLTLIGTTTWQHSDRSEGYAYYAPSEVFQAGGNLMGSTWIGLADGSVLGLGLRAYGGTFRRKTLATDTWVPRIKAEAEATVSLQNGHATWTLAAVGTTTYNQITTAWDYWFAYARLGLSMKMPTLLAP